MRKNLAFLVLLSACGPVVDEEGASDPAAAGTTGTDAATTADDSSGDPSATVDTGGGDVSTGAPEAVCGDGQTEVGEACDDGNTDNADGCSTTCEVSGTISWSTLVDEGFGVGLTSRNGTVVGAVQQYAADGPPSIVVAGYDRDGESLGAFVDIGGLSDLDIARNPIELLPQGTIALAYPVWREEGSRRNYAVLDLEAGIQFAYTEEDPERRWSTYYGVASVPDGVLVLHDERRGDERPLVLERFSEDGGRRTPILWSSNVDERMPLFHGGVLRRSFPVASAVTARPTGELDLRSVILSDHKDGYAEYVWEDADATRAAAFSDDVALWIWTGVELVHTDEFGAPLGAEARAFDGDLLWADAFGLVVSTPDALVLYDGGGAERLSIPLPLDATTGAELRPRFVRPDAEGAGLFVLTDGGIPADGSSRPVVLHYIVR